MASLIFFMSLWVNTALALDFSSGPQATTVIQLFTSEGCSSCPPADRWLSQWQQDSRLFKSVIPLAFHVDYWDQLGWKDRFAQSKFSERQRNLAHESFLSQVYTPAFVVANKEWRGWFRQRVFPRTQPTQAGLLKANLEDRTLKVSYSEQGSYVLNVSYLGMGLTSMVTAGENRLKLLKHDFVVLSWQRQLGDGNWLVNLDAIPKKGQQRTAICIWLSKPGTEEIIQASATFIH